MPCSARCRRASPTDVRSWAGNVCGVRYEVPERLLKFVLVAAVVLAIAIPQAASAATAPKPVKVVFFGDSIVYESGVAIASQARTHPNWNYKFESYPGVALCQMQHPLSVELAKTHPQIIVLETMGNSNVKTPCMKDQGGVLNAFGTAGWLTKYRTDLHAFFKAASDAKVKVLFVNPIPADDAAHNAGLTRLMNVAATEARKFHGVSITSAPRHAVSDNGVFTRTKPCLPSEGVAQGCDAQSHTIGVRAPDGIHLCTPGLEQVSQKCLVYSSGEVRFGAAVVSATFHLPRPALP